MRADVGLDVGREGLVHALDPVSKRTTFGVMVDQPRLCLRPEGKSWMPTFVGMTGGWSSA